ncbi:MAG TPA: hypothetical protein VM759_08765, partial [Longimicrobium sp.]|nr:hypothetical protein [Longimicrobium sp.]
MSAPRGAGPGASHAAAEFAPGATARPDGLSRRAFVRLMGASAALAGLDACTRLPRERILPYVDQPPEVTPGLPRFYATSMVLDGYATGLLVASREGRPVKVEGNPDHPASLGASGVFEQASILQLYDPDRSQSVLDRGRPTTWDELVGALDRAQGWWGPRGERLRFLLEPTSSPLLIGLMDRIRERHPAAGFHFHLPAGRVAAWEGARLAFGRPLEVMHDFAQAAVIVSLDADFLATGPFSLRHAHDFALRRRTPTPATEMNRLYVAGPRLTPTASMADHRLRVRRRSEKSWA